MITYLKGKLVEKSPTHAVIECEGIGYFVHISLQTYSHLPDNDWAKIFVHEVIREDSRSLYGFFDEDEREVFRKLISVSGVGASTGRVILSSLGTEEIRDVIFQGRVDVMKQIKGIGAKTAQRIIVDLQDKIMSDSSDPEKISFSGNTTKNEALSALSSLGYDKTKADKTLDKILKQEGNNIPVEELIKLAMKQM